MKKPHDKVDEVLRRALHDLHSPASESDWEAIRERLRKEKPKPGALRPKKTILFSALLLVTIASGLFIWNDTREESTGKINVQNTPGQEYDLQEKSVKLSTSEIPANPEKPGPATKYISSGVELRNVSHESGGESLSEMNTKADRQTPVSPLAKKHLLYSPEIMNGITSMLKISSSQLKPFAGISSIMPGKPKRGQWRFTLSVMPFVSGGENVLNESKIASTHKDYLPLLNTSEKSSPGFGAGFEAEHPLIKNISVQSGLRYVQQRESVHYDFYNSEVPVIDGQTGEILGYVTLNDSQHAYYRGVNTYHYALLPFSLTYELGLTQKISIGLKAGGLVQFSLGSDGKTIRPDDLSLDDLSGDGMRKINVGYTLAVGVYYQLGPLISLGLQPTYQQSILSANNTGSNRQQKQNATGINAALRFSLF